MRDRTPRAPKLDWPGGIVPEWAKTPEGARKKRGAAQKGGKRERLQKVMAQSGYGSRRNVEILIAQGHITINGETAKLGDQVGPGDRVKLDGRLIHLRYGEALPRVLLYHKPEGEICTRDDPEGRPTVFDKLPRLNNARWVSVGRLDFNTSGLLIFTTSGDLANRLMHPRFEVEREYAVRLLGTLDEAMVQRLTKEGVEIEGENCRFDRLEDRGGEGANHWYHVVLREGKNREVRRMFEAVGLTVSRLMRVRYGPVELPGFVKRGMTRDMAEDDIAGLLAFAGMAESEEEEGEDDEATPGNEWRPEERAKANALEDEDFDDEDDRQPAHLMHGYREPAAPVFEDDDDRQPDFERLPGFNRATGTMGLPAGHRGTHWAAGAAEGPRPPAGAPGSGKKKRGKKAKHGNGGGNVAPTARPAGKGKARFGKGAPTAPGQGAGHRGGAQARGPEGGGPAVPRSPEGQGPAGAPGAGKRKRRRGGKGRGQGAPATAQGAVQGGAPQGHSHPRPPAADGGPAGGGPAGAGKSRRGRRGRGRNRRKGEGGGPAGPASGGGPAAD